MCAVPCAHLGNQSNARSRQQPSHYGHDNHGGTELVHIREEECTVKDGRIEQKNFDTFGSIRLAQMPPVETIIIEGGGKDWGGIGEPTICVAAPAVLNAIYRATGKRLRNVPLKNSGMTLV